MLNFVSLGSCLRQWRLSWKITQEQAAESVNVSVETIRNIEHGNTTPSVDTLCALLDLYEIPMKILEQHYIRDPAMNERIESLKVKQTCDLQYN